MTTTKIAPTTIITTAEFDIPDTDDLGLAVVCAKEAFGAYVRDNNSATRTIMAPTLARAVRDLRAHVKATDYPFLGTDRATVLVFLENSFTLKAPKPE